MPELVLYGIRLMAKQFLGTVLDIEVDHSGVMVCHGIMSNTGWLLTLEMIGDNSEHHLSLPVVRGCDDSQQIVTGFRFLSFYRGQASFHHNEL